MGLKYGGLMFVSSLLVITCEGQRHLLKYINVGNKPPNSAPPQFNSGMDISELRNVKNKFATADRLCVNGMWALFNTTDFGEGAEDSTTVISLRGTDINTCTRSGQIPVLKNVQSVLYLGSADMSLDGVSIYSQPYLLGGLWNAALNGLPSPLPMSITGFPLGSLAITGSKAWLICGDMDMPCSNGVCVDMKDYANLFLQRNVAKDNSVANGWPKTVRNVVSVSSDVCSNYPNPVPLNTRKFVRRDTLGLGDRNTIDASVYKLSS